MPIIKKNYTHTHASDKGYNVPISTSTTLILEAADNLGVTYREIPDTRVFEMKYGDSVKYFHAQIPQGTAEIGFHSCLDKEVTKGFFREAGIQTPKGFKIGKEDSKEYWKDVYDALQKPLVVKPTHGNQGKSVLMNITDYDSYEKAIESAFSISNEDYAGAIVEETFNGTEYRILASREKVIGIMNRRPANVTGDGSSTIQQLIEVKNSDPRRYENADAPLVKIKVDAVVTGHLAAQGLTIDSVPAKDQNIQLRPNSNISTGGDSYDVTDEADKSIHEIALKVINALPNLAWAGIDIITTDITKPQTPDSYTIVEVNSSPGFNIHQFPYSGTPRQPALEFLYIMFPELKP